MSTKSHHSSIREISGDEIFISKINFLFISPRATPIFFLFFPTFSALFLFFINVRSAGSVLPRNRKWERKPRVYGDTDATRSTDCASEEMYEVDIHFGLWKKRKNTPSSHFLSVCLSVCLCLSAHLSTFLHSIPFLSLSLYLSSHLFLHLSVTHLFLLSSSSSSSFSHSRETSIIIVTVYRRYETYRRWFHHFVRQAFLKGETSWSVSVPRHWSRFIHFCVRRSCEREITRRRVSLPVVVTPCTNR